ncbi:hypothetical protein [Nocardia sp. NRRL S-836]|uniref:hypothetical protein n=1 Tax=Nocardia sp. NRRL S-836 TaxID=1519492 RepID=UPI0006AF974E|nr:hypothetical protein [Nocardia sp. NRRL S-836]KOV89681.1 hypothetical protein ADL03_02280 [Nocardia sp. NRRL S-836]
MTLGTLDAARYFPYRRGPESERVERSAAPTDLEDQRRAVRLDRTDTFAMAVDRPLWAVAALVLTFTLFTPYWVWGLGVSAVCAVTVVLLHRVGRRAYDELRLLDATVGVPVPDDLADEVVVTGRAMHALSLVHDLARTNGHVAGALRQYERETSKFDQAYTTCLYRARAAWVRGDEAGWRAAAEQLPLLASAMAQVLTRIDVL